MATYKTPDVYVEEVSTFPPSVAEVSTAIPAFIGYTEKGGSNTDPIPRRISTLLEYTQYFGEPEKLQIQAAVDGNSNFTLNMPQNDKQHRMYYALDHFFKNGGGVCYVVSVGSFSDDKNQSHFSNGLKALAKEDEPTLIVLSEATTLPSADQYYGLCQEALDQCNKLQDRFCILDVLKNDSDAHGFRSGFNNNLKYGAAYYPYLETTLGFVYDDASVSVSGVTANSTNVAKSYSLDSAGITVRYSGTGGKTPSIEIVQGTGTVAPAFEIIDRKLSIKNVGTGGKTGKVIADAWAAWSDPTKVGFEVVQKGDGTEKAVALAETNLIEVVTSSGNNSISTLGDLKDKFTSLYNSIKLELGKLRVVLPPSPSIAGVYAAVDRDRGVWKAPANVSLNYVVGPTVKITADDQQNLNVDTNGGKSINAIRSFSGKGTMVWGARTLAGNDNEWRYVPVRRLFNMIEESSKKASSFAVFEPNDASTWLKVKGMLESYLYGLWQQGALAGSKAESAYYVNVGLGKTMTAQDILEGRMIIEIGVAAVRPAEFIVLKFSHKLQEA